MITRIITGILLALFAVFVIVKGGAALILAIVAIAVLAANELVDMCKKSGKQADYLLIFLGILTFFCLLYFYSPFVNAFFLSFPIKIAILFLLFAYLLELLFKRPFFPNNAPFLTLRILFFFVVPLICGFLIRYNENGLFSLLFTGLLVWVSDTFSFFGGKLFGKHLLTTISPKKTVEGTVVGFLMVLVFAAIFIKLTNLNPWIYMSLAVIIGIFAPLGDLHESLTKRFLQAKDSSQLLPGHGGMYDRVDSLLFVLPVVFYLLNEF